MNHVLRRHPLALHYVRRQLLSNAVFHSKSAVDESSDDETGFSVDLTLSKSPTHRTKPDALWISFYMVWTVYKALPFYDSSTVMQQSSWYTYVHVSLSLYILSPYLRIMGISNNFQPDHVHVYISMEVTIYTIARQLTRAAHHFVRMRTHRSMN